MLRIHVAVLLCLFVQAVVSAGQDATTPGELRTDSTPNSISIEWDLIGDGDHDATCNEQYRQQGSEEWLKALPLFRVDYQWWYHTERAENPLNLFAGSLMFLEPEAVDAGAIVPNIADDFVSEAPDLGAYEFGGEKPHYGPRDN